MRSLRSTRNDEEPLIVANQLIGVALPDSRADCGQSALLGDQMRSGCRVRATPGLPQARFAMRGYCMNIGRRGLRRARASLRRGELRVRAHEHFGRPIVGAQPQHDAPAVLDESPGSIDQLLHHRLDAPALGAWRCGGSAHRARAGRAGPSGAGCSSPMPPAGKKSGQVESFSSSGCIMRLDINFINLYSSLVTKNL